MFWAFCSCSFQAACSSSMNWPFTMFFVMIYPMPAPVPSGSVLCFAFMHTPWYMCAFSLLTSGKCTLFWQLGDSYIRHDPHRTQQRNTGA